MNREKRISAFVKLGEFLSQFKRVEIENKGLPINDNFFDEFKEQIDQAVNHNGWFTKENVLFALE